MTYCTASAAPRPATRNAATVGATPVGFAKSFALAVCATLAVAVVLSPPAFAQQPDAATPVPKPKKAKAKPAADAQQTAGTRPTPTPAPQAQQPPPPAGPGGDQGQQGPNGQQPVQLIFSPWTKFCLKGEPAEPPDPTRRKSARRARTRARGRAASGRSGPHRAAGRRQETVACHFAAGTAACARHPRHCRQEPADDSALCHLLTNGCTADYEADAIRSAK